MPQYAFSAEYGREGFGKAGVVRALIDAKEDEDESSVRDRDITALELQVEGQARAAKKEYTLWQGTLNVKRVRG